MSILVSPFCYFCLRFLSAAPEFLHDGGSGPTLWLEKQLGPGGELGPHALLLLGMGGFQEDLWR